MAVATFALGCFWAPETAFRSLDGVTNATVGYIGGTVENPTYKQVCTGLTGHAEAVQVEYDEARISYLDLLAAFFKWHDPTTLNRQGPDVGSQYRSAIFFHTPEQQDLATRFKAELEHDNRFGRPIVTQIVAAPTFYPAEEYHQRYEEKNGRQCHILL
jgi:peptide-methionine (S)-S-oxide reductase